MTIQSFRHAGRSMLPALSLISGLLMAGVAYGAEKAAFLLPGSINDQSWNAQGYHRRRKA